MKKLLILVSIIILAGCGGEGSNTTAGAGAAADVVSFGKFRPGKYRNDDVKISCKQNREATKEPPAIGTFFIDSKAQSNKGIVLLGSTGGGSCT